MLAFFAIIWYNIKEYIFLSIVLERLLAMKYRIAVCDDEEFCRTGLAEVIRENGFFKCEVSVYSGAQQLINDITINHNIPDILIMDVQLKDIDGIEAVRSIQKKLRMMKIIYISGNYFNSERIFATVPSGFLVKPIGKQKLIEAILRVIEEVDKVRNETITISCGDKTLRSAKIDVKYLESRGRKITVYRRDGKNEEFIGKLDDVEISANDFFRIHQSFIVNFEYVEKIEGGFAFLDEDIKLPISRTRAKDVGAAFASYLGGLV